MFFHIYGLVDFLFRTCDPLSECLRLFQSADIVDKFWSRHPALLYAFAVALGSAAAFRWQWMYLLPCLLLFYPLFLRTPGLLSRLKIRLILALTLAGMSALYVQATYLFPDPYDEHQKCSAVFSIDTLTLSSHYFGKQWSYRGTLQRVYDSDSGKLIGKNLPCTLYMPQRKDAIRPAADRNYWIQGKLHASEEGGYRFRTQKSTPWQEIAYTHSFAEIRHAIKQWVVRYIEGSTPHSRSATFLTGIATGEFQDRQMIFEFGRFGLQHILAISGFHFAIVAAILSLLLRLVIPRKPAALLLTFLLCSYFFFLGPSASIMRAWIMILIVMLGYLFERTPIGLNSLGAAVLVILLIDPLMLYRVGFQFSVIVTGSILMNYSCFDHYVRRLLPKRPLSEVSLMDALNQHGYCIIAFFRQAVALGLAVNLAAIPILLFHFGKFPLMSFFYNLFFPFLVSISMLFLILGILTSLVPPLSALIHSFNSAYTHFLLNLVYNMPTKVDYFIKMPLASFEIVLAFLSLLFFASLFERHRLENQQQEMQNFAFL